MAFNATFNNIVAVSLIGGGNREYTEKTESTRRKPRSTTSHWQTLSHIEYTSPWERFELTTLVIIGTDCIGSCNYHKITTTNY